VVAIGERWVPEMFSLVVVVVVETYCMMMVVVMGMVMGMIHIQSL